MSSYAVNAQLPCCSVHNLHPLRITTQLVRATGIVCLTENPRNQNAWNLQKYPYQWSRPFLLENSIKSTHKYSSCFQPSWTQVRNIWLTAFKKIQTWTTSLRFILHNRMNELFVCTRTVQCPSPGTSIYINTQKKHNITGRWLGKHSKLLAILLHWTKESDKCTDYELN